jgi:cytochrome c oxidase cbb3-type subunit 4
MSIDLNSLRSIVTVVSLLLFIGLMVWTWSRRRSPPSMKRPNCHFWMTTRPAPSTHK